MTSSTAVVRGEVDADFAVVMPEPSCATVFGGELMNLFLDDQEAIRLSKQTVCLCQTVAVRGAGREDLLISVGFSCREQVSDHFKRRAVHVAEVLAGRCR